MVFHVISVVATPSTVPAFIESTAWPRSTPALLVFGRLFIKYLPAAPMQWLGSYSVYMEEMLTVLVIVLAHTTLAAPSKRQARIGTLSTVLTALLKLLAQPVNALAGQIYERGRWRHPGHSDHPSPLEMNTLQGPVADPHTALSELLRAVEASDGFIAVRQGNWFAVVASVNALPVGHRLELAGQMGAMVRPNAAAYAAVSAEPEQSLDASFTLLVEQALKELSDYTRLGRSSLVNRLRIESGPQIEQGKALRQLLVEAIEGLRPAGAEPNGPPPREWYAYTILRDAYIDDVPNRNIMARLYISEGTFNRWRRKAIQAVATSVWESCRLGAGPCPAELVADLWQT